MRQPRQFALVAVLTAFGLAGLGACATSRTAEPGEEEQPGPASEAPGEEAQAPEGEAPEGAAAEGEAAGEEMAAAAHPQVPPEADCFECHQQNTPQVAEAWQQSPHGMALVKCFVCHGSTGEDFAAAPEPTSCDSCHPTEAQSVGGSGCYGCHEPHTLAAEGENPHQDGGA